MKKIFTVLIFAFAITKINAQTNVSGGIYNNATWTLANSPYIVVDSVVVFPGVTLAIEPGVVVKFDSAVNLEIRQGTLIALGTITDSITFTSNVAAPHAGIWKGISFNNAGMQFNYCIFKYAANAMGIGYTSPLTLPNLSFYSNTNCILGNSADLTVKHASFYNNESGISTYSNHEIIDSCIFVNNTSGVTNGDGLYGVKVYNSEFYSNHSGVNLHDIGVYDVVNCKFCDNYYACTMWGVSAFAPFDSVAYCTFSNSHVGFQNYVQYLIGNVFENNDTAFMGDIRDTAYMYDNSFVDNQIGWLGGTIGSNIHVYNNNICRSSIYNIQYQYNSNVLFPGICFCTTDSTSIAASIYDGYDNITLGLVTVPLVNCDSSVLTGIPVINCPSFTTGSEGIKAADNGFILFPNPTTYSFTITTQLQNAQIEIYNLLGKKVGNWQVAVGEKEITIDVSELNSGIYFVKVQSEKGTSVQKLIVQYVESKL